MVNRHMKRCSTSLFRDTRDQNHHEISPHTCFRIAIIKKGFPVGTEVKDPPVNAGDTRDTALIPGWGRSPGVGNSNPLQYPSWKIPWTEEPGGLQSMGSKNSWI